MKELSIPLILIFLICSCNRPPKDVRMALYAAGSNRPELEKVLGHYSQNPADSLKLKAAYFLIGNMVDKYYYEGELLDIYSEYFHLISNDEVRNKEILDSIAGIYGPFSVDRLERKTDLEHLKATYLINNIDMAFKVWLEQPWGKDISFNQFCEYILPYRVGTERPEYDRSEIYRQYNSLLDSIRMTGGTAIDACSVINNEFKRIRWQWTHILSSFPNFPVNALLNLRKGNCREKVDLTIFVMRALGIPVTIDFTPQWGARSRMGHNWNVVLDKEGKNQVFMGTESNPGVKHLSDNYKITVVYRKTFAPQSQSLAMVKRKNDEVPPLFENPHLKIVSKEYFKDFNVTILLDRKEAENKKYAYICVFNNVSWAPVSWGKIINNDVVFQNLSCNDIVYLPAYYIKGELVPANDPFILTKGGKMNYLKSDNSHKQDMILIRKFPFPLYIGNMAGGQFQGSNYADFKYSTDLYKIPEADSTLIWKEISLNSDKGFRYYRYLGPKGSHGSIAELEFYIDSNKVHGNLICGSKRELMPKYAKENVKDGDILTFFYSDKADGAWVGTDCGKRVKINKIRYMPRNDDNNITKGQTYELAYWENDQWISAGVQIAMEDNRLVYRNIPSSTLYLLHNLTKGKEERIFTYENGKQVWW
jgi:hypothetical protein